MSEFPEFRFSNLAKPEYSLRDNSFIWAAILDFDSWVRVLNREAVHWILVILFPPKMSRYRSAVGLRMKCVFSVLGCIQIRL